MELTKEEKELIIKIRKESVETDEFKNLINKLKESADSQIELVEKMNVSDATNTYLGENSYSPLRMIYERSEPFLHPYGHNNLNPEQKKELDKLYSEYSSKAQDIFRTLLEKEFENVLSKLPDKAKDKIYYKSWEKGHAYGFGEVYYEYTSNIDFINEILN